MSKVISFRVDENNPREAKALAILQRWQEDGFKIRPSIIEAILQMEGLRSAEKNSDLLVEMNEKLCHVSQLIENLFDRDNHESPDHNTTTKGSTLSDNLIASVMRTAKPGIKFHITN